MKIKVCNGDDGIRTHDLRLAKPALSQLSYIPGGLENTLFRMHCQESPSTEAAGASPKTHPTSEEEVSIGIKYRSRFGPGLTKSSTSFTLFSHQHQTMKYNVRDSRCRHAAHEKSVYPTPRSSCRRHAGEMDGVTVARQNFSWRLFPSFRGARSFFCSQFTARCI